MKKLIFRVVALTVIFSHLSTLCLRDISLAAPVAKSSNSNTNQAASTQATAKSAKDNSTSSAPPANPESAQKSSKKSLGGSSSSGSSTPSAAGLNTGALQALQADPFTGRAVFSLPIYVPQGRRGIQPNISLTYSSGAGNGPLGVGWSLELGAIERSTKKGAPKYDDNSDTFVFNSGGSSSELVSIGSGQYRAKIEGAFMRFQFNGSSWTVTDKSGTKYFFGQDASSRIEDGSRKFKWALDKVLDLHGNYLSAIYAKDQNQLYPEKIQYTGNEPAGLSPLGLVEFEFDERSDTSINYRPGFKLVTGRRLTDIKVRFNQKQISRYQLDYATSGSSQSLLNSFTQFGADDSSTLPAITFDYQQPSPGWDLSGQRLPDKYGSFDSSTVITDVNNDGFPDIVANSRGTFLGTKDGSWQETTFWKFPAGHSIGPGTRLTDIDADGWVDMIEHVHGEGGGHSFVIYLNNRQNGWQRNSAWEAKFPGEAYFSFDHGGRWADPTGAQLADVNGDGLVDYLQAKWDGRYVWLGTGSTWKSDTTYTTPVDTSFYDGSTQLGDLNGDGLSDLLVARAERKAVYLNTGSGWQRTPEFDPPSDSVIDFVNGSTQLVDINADGLADLVVAKSGTQRAYLNRGPKLGWQEDGSYRLPEGDFSNSQTRLADSKARGSLDILINQSSNQNKVYLNRANSPANYLSKITNGIGGELSIAYKPSTQFDNTAGDGTSGLPFPVYAVDTLTIHDSVNSDNPDITTRYEYKGGLFDFSEREFRGFAYVKTIDAEGNFSETYFKQGLLDKGRPYRQVARASSGNLYAKTLNTWDTTREPYPGVYFVRLTQTDSYGYDGASSEGGANFKHTQTTFAYDDYGNSTRVTTGVNSAEHPETISDTKTQVSEYAYNTADWLVAAPKRSYLLGNQNPQALNEKRFYYDQQIDFNAPPKKGLLTQEAVLVLNPLTQAKCYAINQYRYDAFGNLIKSVGPLGRVTATAYDSFTQSYPIKVTNPLGQSIENIYYGINDPPLGALDGSGLFGQLKSTQDLNQQRVYSLYDTFGRLTKVIGPLDSLEYPATLYEYDLSSAPIKISQYVKFTSEQTSQPYYASYSFFDGLGRAIYSKTPAQADPQTSVPRQIISGITRYNAKGQVIEKYLPYFTEESPDYVSADYSTLHTSFTYDGLGRVTQTTNPDQTYSSASYSVWEAASIDSNGHKTNKRFDSWGRIAQVEEFTGADGRSADYSYQPYQLYATTRYLYDALGNLIQLTDNQNNTTRIWYDSLGRKLRMSDPDMGIWSYEYDLVGNLIRQTDAKAQKLVFTYDGLNRLVSKALEKRRRAMQLKRDSESETLVTYIYDAPVSLKPNCIGRLSQVIDQSGSTEFFYDNLGREVKSIKSLRGASASSLSLRGAVGDKAISYTVERGYDPLGRLTNLKYPDSGIVKYEYNPQGIERVLKGDSLKEKTVYASTASGADQGTVPDNFTKLLWHADTIGSLTAHGGAKIDTAQKKSGLGSAFFDGKDDYFTLPDSPDWTFGKDDFTIDFWVKFNSLDGDKYIMICGQRVDDRNLWYIYYHYDNKWSVCATIDGKSQIGAFLGGGPPELNTWYHIAIVRNNNKLLLFINGVLNSFNYGSDITGADLSDINSDLSIGSAYNNAGGGGVRGYFNGWIDDFRITKSLARWTESFNPESEGTIPAALEGTIPATAGSGVDQGTVPKVHISKITYLPTGQIAKITYGNATETNYTYDPQTLRLTNLTTEGSAGSTAEAVPPDEGTVPAAVGSGVDQGTPPAGEAGVPDSFTKLLLHVDSLERSGSSHLLPDSSSANHPAALHGNARLDTTEKKFGLSSVFFDGQNSYLSLGTSPDWSFGSEDFTIDLWVKFKDLAGHPAQSFLTQENGRTPGKWGFWDFSYNNGKLHLTFVDDADKDVGRFNVDFSSPATDTWYHFAVEKKGIDCYLFINGVSQQVNVSTPWAATLPCYSGPLYIGCNYTLRAGFVDGWLDEIRVTKGLARWTENFIPLEGLPLPAPFQEEAVPREANSRVLLQDLKYQFDSNGNVKSITDYLNTASQYFTYDALSRLIEADGPNSYGRLTYGYDSIGNMTEKEGVAMQYGQNGRLPHAVTRYGDITLTYDANGNLINKKGLVVGTAPINANLAPEQGGLSPNPTTTSASYTYDCENRLTQVQGDATITSFTYDGDGGRVSKVVGTVPGQAGSAVDKGTVPKASVATYIGSLFEITGQTGLTSQTITRHIFSGSQRVCSVTREVGSKKKSLAKVRYFHTDHLGSSNIISDSSGRQVGHYEYTPYGSFSRQEPSTENREPNTAAQPTTRFFTGKELDDSTGLYYYGARYYDPTLGRFITPDTIVQAPYDPQSLNRYSYCRNNPINYIDPTGHKWSWTKFWHAAVGVFVGVVASMLLGPGGLLMITQSWAVAGAIGGAAGGALTGGLDGGWKGALIGGAMGGALGAFGGWVSSIKDGAYAGWVLGGGIVAGAAVAGATDSWDSFAGGLAGGLAGWGAGTGINSSEHLRNFKAGKGFVSNQEAAAKAGTSLKVDLSDDPPVQIFYRGLEGFDGKPQGIKIHPIMKDWEGNYHELGTVKIGNKQFIKILGGNKSNMSAATKFYLAGNPQPDEITMVYGSKFFQAIKSYKSIYEGQEYRVQSSIVNPDEFNCIGFKNYVINQSKYE